MPTRQEILDYYNSRCVLDISHPANHVHEIVTKAQDPKGWDTFKNRVPLCPMHHEQIHREGASKWADRLREAARHLAHLLH